MGSGKAKGLSELRLLCRKIKEDTKEKGGRIPREKVCEMLGISQSTLNQKTRKGIIPCYKMTGYKKLVYYENEIHEFIKRAK